MGDEYIKFIVEIIKEIKNHTDNLYLWGYPNFAALFVNKIPSPLQYSTWLTWYFNNHPAKFKGWGSNQQTCLHYAIPKTKFYPQHFFNKVQKEKYETKKMRFVPGPTSVIEENLSVSFIGKNGQIASPEEKPVNLYNKLLKMVTNHGDLVFDPMCGTGTTSVACNKLNVKSIISDNSEAFIKICEKRLGTKRLNFDKLLSKK